jgi:hypothetical protein
VEEDPHGVFIEVRDAGFGEAGQDYVLDVCLSPSSSREGVEFG